ncbi:hypothetical protein Lesp02_71200 [Lentzea sp. NBRC 105346]|uniref:hypothetical protein n=1 Tax=Lentzea sp. NBRC 105346 TaxID=3032205 RepID=UPI0024A38003|nr:hypothetical protein [Lentzea sp. NBRC 105346]GLZ34933.1 hypothetical protein Lesp02_71200 [Lentzea sp. NBRC 105346]
MSSRRWVVVALVVLGLGAAGCAAPASSTKTTAPEKPAKVEAIAGKSVKSVTLTEQAEKRVGLDTVQIAAGAGGTTVPYAAVLYTPDGKTWVYTVAGTRSYVREQVVIASVTGATGDVAVLSQSPAVGTTIVKTGLIELYGAELGVGK